MEVSALGFGCMGMTYNRSAHPGKRECIALIRSAAERGVTLFDTAIIYGPLNNEELAGEALEPFKGKVALTTKFGHEVVNGKGTGRQDSRPETIKRYCDESLKRLRLDCIELFYQHRFDPKVPVEDVAGRGGRADEGGQGKALGSLARSARTSIRRAHAVQPLTAVQSEYHLMWREVEKNGVLRACEELGIGFVPYSPINRGFLGGCINEYTRFDPKNDNRPSLPRFSPEAIRANMLHCRRAQRFRQDARGDLCADRAGVAPVALAVDSPDSRDDKAIASGRKPAGGRLLNRARRMGRARSQNRRDSGRRRPLQR